MNKNLILTTCFAIFLSSFNQLVADEASSKDGSLTGELLTNENLGLDLRDDYPRDLYFVLKAGGKEGPRQDFGCKFSRAS